MNQKELKMLLPLTGLMYLMLLLGGSFPVQSQDSQQRPQVEVKQPVPGIGQIPVRIRLNRFDPPLRKRHMYYA